MSEPMDKQNELEAALHAKDPAERMRWIVLSASKASSKDRKRMLAAIIRSGSVQGIKRLLEIGAGQDDLTRLEDPAGSAMGLAILMDNAGAIRELSQAGASLLRPVAEKDDRSLACWGLAARMGTPVGDAIAEAVEQECGESLTGRARLVAEISEAIGALRAETRLAVGFSELKERQAQERLEKLKAWRGRVMEKTVLSQAAGEGAQPGRSIKRM